MSGDIRHLLKEIVRTHVVLTHGACQGGPPLYHKMAHVRRLATYLQEKIRGCVPSTNRMTSKQHITHIYIHVYIYILFFLFLLLLYT